MATIRGVKNRKFKFVQLLNEMLEDLNLSLKAKGFIGYCLTKPEDWYFHINHLCQHLKEGEKAIYSTIDECIEQGYAIRYQKRKENGDFGEWETIVSDSKEEIALLKEELKNDTDFQKSITVRCFAGPHNTGPHNAVPQNASHSNNVAKEVICNKHQQEKVAGADEKKSEVCIKPETDIDYVTSSGEKKTISQSDIFRHFLKFPYKTELIQEAIGILKNEKGPVNNPLNFLQSICLRLDKKPIPKAKSSPKAEPTSSGPGKCTSKSGNGINLTLKPVIPKISRYI